MEIKELCDLLEVTAADNKKIAVELYQKLVPIITTFSVAIWPTASLLAKKGNRSERELKYLEQKGLVKFHGERDIGTLYKLTQKGIEAYEVYASSFLKNMKERDDTGAIGAVPPYSSDNF